jgi:hypothetical protein
MRGWLETIGLATRPPDYMHLEPMALAAKLEGNLAADPNPEPERVALEIYEDLW